MERNIGNGGRALRASIGVVLLAYGLWQMSWVAIGFGFFTLYEAVASWCVVYQLLGIQRCAIREVGEWRHSYGVLFFFMLLCFGMEVLSEWSGKGYEGFSYEFFSPIWTALYASLAVVGWWIYSARHGLWKRALLLYALLLSLTVLWPILFFRLQLPFVALAEVVFLWFTSVAAIRCFASIRRTAALLLIPYFLWVSYLCYFNALALVHFF